MNFDPLNKAACLVNLVDGGDAGNQPDARCNDAAFASAHPDICGSQSYLIIKPSSALIMRLSGVSYTVFEYANGIESQVIDGLHFTSSNPDIFLIGASTGSGTGLAKGSSIITVTRNGLSASATVTVLDSTVGCSETAVKSFILVDNSRSTSLSFGGVWNTRLDFAKAAAQRWADKLIVVDGAAKDGFKVSSFSDSIVDVTGDYIGDQTILDADINAIQQTLDKTDIFDPLSAAILDLTLAVADEKVLILISDGEQTTSTNFQPILDSAASFKAAGGVIIAIGLRASGLGFDLLERIATGGFFLNGTTATAQAVLDGLAFLKSAVCAGECVAAGDVYENRAQLDYSSFKNWEVIKGQVDLIGNGEYDYLPGNGLYVDMIGSHGYTRDNTIRSIDRFSLVAGSDYTIAFDVAGNNRQDVGPQSIKVYLRDPDAPATDPNIFEHLVSPEWDAGFQLYSFTFNSPKTLSAKIYFQQVLADATLDSPFGNILDDVVFSDANLNVLLSDNFDSENSTYIPPACGTSGIFQSPVQDPPAPSYLFSPYPGGNMDDCGSTPLDDAGVGARTKTEVSDGTYFQFTTPNFINQVAFTYAAAATWPLTISGSNDLISWVVIKSVNVIGSPNTGSAVLFDPVKYTYIKLAYNKASVSISAYSFSGISQIQCKYLYAISYLTTSGETKLSPLSDISSIDFSTKEDSAVTVTMPVPSDPRVTSKRLWRNDNNASSSMLLLAVVAVSASTYIDIETHGVFSSRASSFPAPPTYNSTLGGGFLALIPPMASPSSAFGTASSNSDDGFNHAFGAFSGVQYDLNSPGSFWQSAVPNSDQSIQFQFSTAQTVSQYSFAGSSGRDSSPTSWTLQGSNDGSNWVVLDTVVHHVWTNSNAHYVSDNHNVDVFNIPNTTPYIYYKIVVTDSVNKAALISLFAGYQIWQLQMYASVPGMSYGYVSSYYGCYGDQCSQSASEAAQYQDPNPLPDIESGAQPQKFTSTQNACAACLDGNVNTSPVSAVPLMTTDSTPSGLASANSEFGFPNSDAHNAFDGDDSTAWFAFNGNPPEFLQYKFAAAMAASAYSVKVLQQQIPVFVPAPVTYPLGFDFQASNDGSNWITLDSQASLIWSPGEEKRFPVSNSSAYLYYRLNYGGSEQSGLGEICKFGIYGSAPSQICKQGTATSYISQSDADSKALAAATNAANSALNCVHIYTSTQSYTAVCPLGNGTPVTQTANASSFVSQADADASATAVAKAAAIAALVCSNSNNTQQITINDNAAASPYPSVKVVSGLVGHITKVTVAINGLRHSYPNDISMLLVSPSGTKVNIIRSCGGQVLVTGINLVLDDSAGSSLSNTTMANGTFKPTQFGLFNAFPAPCPTGTPLLTLAAFIGEVGNGAWALYVQDTKSQDAGLIAAGFDLTIASA